MPTGLIDCSSFLLVLWGVVDNGALDALRYSDAVPHHDAVPYHDAGTVS